MPVTFKFDDKEKIIGALRKLLRHENPNSKLLSNIHWLFTVVLLPSAEIFSA